MKTVHVTPVAQIALVAAALAAVIAAVVAQLPEIRRYMKVRSMD
jgi:hypothetical protein